MGWAMVVMFGRFIERWSGLYFFLGDVNGNGGRIIGLGNRLLVQVILILPGFGLSVQGDGVGGVRLLTLLFLMHFGFFDEGVLDFGCGRVIMLAIMHDKPHLLHLLIIKIIIDSRQSISIKNFTQLSHCSTHLFTPA